ncbi:MAG TPA: class I SAM-dependent methyltransferase [Geminicoccaceae bacterium]|nr:class I SAM-dependent methyltransferase [Geminicoccaceae bacterium]
MNPLERLTYDVTQAARRSWFLGNYLLAARMTGPLLPRERVPEHLPDRDELLGDLRALFARDRANIQAGFYLPPHDMLVSPLEVLRRSRLFFDDLRRVHRRRREGEHQEVFEARRDEGEGYPRYYLQNFHYQSDGWLSDRSAELYDYQVEVLFNGGADAMRRQALVPLHHHLKGRRIAECRLLDVACGTGRFLTFVKQNYPRLPVVGLDLSPNYLGKARQNLAPWSWVELQQGKAEELPFEDASFDVVSCVYLFHELPREVRRRAAVEFARVLRPGGRALFVDSIQYGDKAEYDGLIDFFPLAYHEPYYADYARTDLPALFADAGLEHEGSHRAFMSKAVVLRKPEG